MEKKHCNGCRDDFYNGNNPLKVASCWSFDKKKKLVTKFKLSVHTPMNIKGAYIKSKVPPCYHRDGFVFLDQIPNYAK